MGANCQNCDLFRNQSMAKALTMICYWETSELAFAAALHYLQNVKFLKWMTIYKRKQAFWQKGAFLQVIFWVCYFQDTLFWSWRSSTLCRFAFSQPARFSLVCLNREVTKLSLDSDSPRIHAPRKYYVNYGKAYSNSPAACYKEFPVQSVSYMCYEIRLNSVYYWTVTIMIVTMMDFSLFHSLFVNRCVSSH